MEAILTETVELEKIHQLALDNQLAVVSYRLPQNHEVTTLMQWTNQPLIVEDIPALEGKSGFVFCPFDTDSDLPIRLIQPDLIIRGDILQKPEPQQFTDSKHNTVVQRELIPAQPYQAEKPEYLQQVESVKKHIQTGSLDKLVLSRISRESMPGHFQRTRFFEELSKAYPDAFVFMLYIVDAGLWFGASPEPLLQSNHATVNTVSLAGTRIFKEGNPFSTWGEKELEEQGMVTRYIEDVLQKAGIERFEKAGPYSYKAGKIEHLKTSFTIDATYLRGKLAPLLNALHPTPSVCGLPKREAMEAIKTIEAHNREYYSGFLGPVNMDNQWNIFVNLRSMKAGNDYLAYFLGAGITEGSDAEKEWEETLNKQNTLQSIVNQLKNF